jgi:hypothetical protein
MDAKNKYSDMDAKIKSHLDANIHKTFTIEQAKEMDARIRKYLSIDDADADESYIPWLFSKKNIT